MKRHQRDYINHNHDQQSNLYPVFSQNSFNNNYNNNYNNNHIQKMPPKIARNPKRSSEISPSSLRVESKLDAILSELRDFRTTSAHHEQQINFLHEQNCHNEQKLSEHHMRWIDNDRRWNDNEQLKLDPIMEISGLQLDEECKSNPEALRIFVYNFLRNIGYNLELIEIPFVNCSSGVRHNGESFEVVRVTFLHEAIKRRIMMLKLNKQPIYFSHALTKYNRTLLGNAKRLARNREIHSAWTMGGRVFIKEKEDGAKLRIVDSNQLSSITVSRNHSSSRFQPSSRNQTSKQFTNRNSQSNAHNTHHSPSRISNAHYTHHSPSRKLNTQTRSNNSVAVLSTPIAPSRLNLNTQNINATQQSHIGISPFNHTSTVLPQQISNNNNNFHQTSTNLVSQITTTQQSSDYSLDE